MRGPDAAGREGLRRAWRAAGAYGDLTVGAALAAGAAAHPDDAIVFAAVDGPTEHATLARLHAEARRLAAALHEMAPSLDDLVAHAREAGLAAHKLPAQVVLVDALPRTPAGKVRKQDLPASLHSAADR